MKAPEFRGIFLIMIQQKIHQLKNYIAYLLKARNEHSIHSPFLYKLYTDIIRNGSTYYCFDEIEQLRNSLKKYNKTIPIEDLGAGSITKNKTVADIARHSLCPPSLAQILFKLINEFKPKNIIELGTSLGLTTAYLASANKSSTVYSIEGSSTIALIAQHTFKKLNLNNIQLILGNIDDELNTLVNKLDSVDFVYFDGNHRKIPTLNYFECCLKKATDNSIFIFDDIYWSQEMTDAWQEIKKHEKVTISIDLFRIGIVFFRKENRQKEDFVLRF